ncbi:hypothetical protein ABT369_09175 [Dactylosporangium sp. NPDC000244]|uniref:WXG100-like domain-containing protein n=1 Tax=Dactylosporangium sp. NPDC000244 TaxID=3154365 RepID=UPI0033240D9D
MTDPTEPACRLWDRIRARRGGQMDVLWPSPDLAALRAAGNAWTTLAGAARQSSGHGEAAANGLLEGWPDGAGRAMHHNLNVLNDWIKPLAPAMDGIAAAYQEYATFVVRIQEHIHNFVLEQNHTFERIRLLAQPWVKGWLLDRFADSVADKIAKLVTDAADQIRNPVEPTAEPPEKHEGMIDGGLDALGQFALSLAGLAGYGEGGFSVYNALMAWDGFGKLALALGAYGPMPTGVMWDQSGAIPTFDRGELGRTLADTGKAMVAWDTPGADIGYHLGFAGVSIAAALGIKGTGTVARVGGALAKAGRMTAAGEALDALGAGLHNVPTVTQALSSVARKALPERFGGAGSIRPDRPVGVDPDRTIADASRRGGSVDPPIGDPVRPQRPDASPPGTSPARPDTGGNAPGGPLGGRESGGGPSGAGTGAPGSAAHPAASSHPERTVVHPSQSGEPPPRTPVSHSDSPVPTGSSGPAATPVTQAGHVGHGGGPASPVAVRSSGGHTAQPVGESIVGHGGGPASTVAVRSSGGHTAQPVREPIGGGLDGLPPRAAMDGGPSTGSTITEAMPGHDTRSPGPSGVAAIHAPADVRPHAGGGPAGRGPGPAVTPGAELRRPAAGRAEGASSAERPDLLPGAPAETGRPAGSARPDEAPIGDRPAGSARPDEVPVRDRAADSASGRSPRDGRAADGTSGHVAREQRRPGPERHDAGPDARQDAAASGAERPGRRLEDGDRDGAVGEDSSAEANGARPEPAADRAVRGDEPRSADAADRKAWRPPLSHGPREPKFVRDVENTKWHREPDGWYRPEAETALRTASGDGPPVAVPAEARGLVDGRGRLRLVVFEDGRAFDRGLPKNGELSAEWLAHGEAGRPIARPVEEPVRLRLADGTEIVVGEKHADAIRAGTAGGAGDGPVVVYRDFSDPKNPRAYVPDDNGRWVESGARPGEVDAWLSGRHRLYDGARLGYRIDARLPWLNRLGDATLGKLVRRGSPDDAMAAAYALIARAEDRYLRWTQLDAVEALRDGHVVNMAAGEGKSLVYRLYATIKAADGAEAVHVLTTRKTLATREFHAYLDLLSGLGFDVHRMNPEGNVPAPRGGHPTVYVGEVDDAAFADLRDKTIPGDVAILDEIDDVLVHGNNEFVISDGALGLATPEVWALVHWAHDLVEGVGGRAPWLTERDFGRGLRAGEWPPNRLRLTDAGRDRLEQALNRDLTPDDVRRLENAARAKWDYKLGRDYTLSPGDDPHIVIIKEGSHEPMTDLSTTVEQNGARESRWNEGLAQAIEAKHGLDIRGDTESPRRITAGELFEKNYKTVVGASGTARGHGEVFAARGLSADIREVPRYYEPRLDIRSEVVPGGEGAKLDRVAAMVEELLNGPRGVLVQCVENYQVRALVERLEQRGVKADFIDADWQLAEHAKGRNWETEFAERIKRAGDPGNVLVSNMMTGRGVDPAQGAHGLEVVITGHSHVSADIDVQAANRAGRNGAAGRVTFVVSSTDAVFTRSYHPEAPVTVMEFDRAVADQRAAAERYEAEPSAGRLAELDTANGRLDAAGQRLLALVPELQHAAAALNQHRILGLAGAAIPVGTDTPAVSQDHPPRPPATFTGRPTASAANGETLAGNPDVTGDPGNSAGQTGVTGGSGNSGVTGDPGGLGPAQARTSEHRTPHALPEPAIDTAPARPALVATAHPPGTAQPAPRAEAAPDPVATRTGDGTPVTATVVPGTRAAAAMFADPNTTALAGSVQLRLQRLGEAGYRDSVVRGVRVAEQVSLGGDVLEQFRPDGGPPVALRGVVAGAVEVDWWSGRPPLLVRVAVGSVGAGLRARTLFPAETTPGGPGVTVVLSDRHADSDDLIGTLVHELWEAPGRLGRSRWWLGGGRPRPAVLTRSGSAPGRGARLSDHDRGGVGDVQALVARVVAADDAAERSGLVRDLAAHLDHLGLGTISPHQAALWRIVDAEVRADRLPPAQRRLYLSLREPGWQLRVPEPPPGPGTPPARGTSAAPVPGPGTPSARGTSAAPDPAGAAGLFWQRVQQLSGAGFSDSVIRELTPIAHADPGRPGSADVVEAFRPDGGPPVVVRGVVAGVVEVHWWDGRPSTLVRVAAGSIGDGLQARSLIPVEPPGDRAPAVTVVLSDRAADPEALAGAFVRELWAVGERRGVPAPNLLTAGPPLWASGLPNRLSGHDVAGVNGLIVRVLRLVAAGDARERVRAADGIEALRQELGLDPEADPGHAAARWGLVDAVVRGKALPEPVRRHLAALRHPGWRDRLALLDAASELQAEPADRSIRRVEVTADGGIEVSTRRAPGGTVRLRVEGAALPVGTLYRMERTDGEALVRVPEELLADPALAPGAVTSAVSGAVAESLAANRRAWLRRAGGGVAELDADVTVTGDKPRLGPHAVGQWRAVAAAARRVVALAEEARRAPGPAAAERLRAVSGAEAARLRAALGALGLLEGQAGFVDRRRAVEATEHGRLPADARVAGLVSPSTRAVADPAAVMRSLASLVPPTAADFGARGAQVAAEESKIKIILDDEWYSVFELDVVVDLPVEGPRFAELGYDGGWRLRLRPDATRAALGLDVSGALAEFVQRMSGADEAAVRVESAVARLRFLHGWHRVAGELVRPVIAAEIERTVEDLGGADPGERTERHAEVRQAGQQLADRVAGRRRTTGRAEAHVAARQAGTGLPAPWMYYPGRALGSVVSSITNIVNGLLAGRAPMLLYGQTGSNVANNLLQAQQDGALRQALYVSEQSRAARQAEAAPQPVVADRHDEAPVVPPPPRAPFYRKRAVPTGVASAGLGAFVWLFGGKGPAGLVGAVAPLAQGIAYGESDYQAERPEQQARADRKHALSKLPDGRRNAALSDVYYYTAELQERVSGLAAAGTLDEAIPAAERAALVGEIQRVRAELEAVRDAVEPLERHARGAVRQRRQVRRLVLEALVLGPARLGAAIVMAPVRLARGRPAAPPEGELPPGRAPDGQYRVRMVVPSVVNALGLTAVTMLLDPGSFSFVTLTGLAGIAASAGLGQGWAAQRGDEVADELALALIRAAGQARDGLTHLEQTLELLGDPTADPAGQPGSDRVPLDAHGVSVALLKHGPALSMRIAAVGVAGPYMLPGQLGLLLLTGASQAANQASYGIGEAIFRKLGADVTRRHRDLIQRDRARQLALTPGELTELIRTATDQAARATGPQSAADLVRGPRAEAGPAPTAGQQQQRPAGSGVVGKATATGRDGDAEAVFASLTRAFSGGHPSEVAIDHDHLSVLVRPDGADYALLFTPGQVHDGIGVADERSGDVRVADRRLVRVVVAADIPRGAELTPDLTERDVQVRRLVAFEVGRATVAEPRGRAGDGLGPDASGRAPALSPADAGRRAELVELLDLLGDPAVGGTARRELQLTAGLMVDYLYSGAPDAAAVGHRTRLLDLADPHRRVVAALRRDNAPWRQDGRRRAAAALDDAAGRLDGGSGVSIRRRDADTFVLTRPGEADEPVDVAALTESLFRAGFGVREVPAQALAGLRRSVSDGVVRQLVAGVVRDGLARLDVTVQGDRLRVPHPSGDRYIALSDVLARAGKLAASRELPVLTATVAYQLGLQVGGAQAALQALADLREARTGPVEAAAARLLLAVRRQLEFDGGTVPAPSVAAAEVLKGRGPVPGQLVDEALALVGAVRADVAAEVIEDIVTVLAEMVQVAGAAVDVGELRAYAAAVVGAEGLGGRSGVDGALASLGLLVEARPASRPAAETVARQLLQDNPRDAAGLAGSTPAAAALIGAARVAMARDEHEMLRNGTYREAREALALDDPAAVQRHLAGLAAQLSAAIPALRARSVLKAGEADAARRQAEDAANEAADAGRKHDRRREARRASAGRAEAQHRERRERYAWIADRYAAAETAARAAADAVAAAARELAGTADRARLHEVARRLEAFEDALRKVQPVAAAISMSHAMDELPWEAIAAELNAMLDDAGAQVRVEPGALAERFGAGWRWAVGPEGMVLDLDGGSLAGQGDAELRLRLHLEDPVEILNPRLVHRETTHGQIPVFAPLGTQLSETRGVQRGLNVNPAVAKWVAAAGTTLAAWAAPLLGHDPGQWSTWAQYVFDHLKWGVGGTAARSRSVGMTGAKHAPPGQVWDNRGDGTQYEYRYRLEAGVDVGAGPASPRPVSYGRMPVMVDHPFTRPADPASAPRPAPPTIHGLPDEHTVLGLTGLVELYERLLARLGPLTPLGSVARGELMTHVFEVAPARLATAVNHAETGGLLGHLTTDGRSRVAITLEAELGDPADAEMIGPPADNIRLEMLGVSFADENVSRQRGLPREAGGTFGWDFNGTADPGRPDVTATAGVARGSEAHLAGHGQRTAIGVYVHKDKGHPTAYRRTLRWRARIEVDGAARPDVTAPGEAVLAHSERIAAAMGLKLDPRAIRGDGSLRDALDPAPPVGRDPAAWWLGDGSTDRVPGVGVGLVEDMTGVEEQASGDDPGGIREQVLTYLQRKGFLPADRRTALRFLGHLNAARLATEYDDATQRGLYVWVENDKGSRALLRISIEEHGYRYRGHGFAREVVYLDIDSTASTQSWGGSGSFAPTPLSATTTAHKDVPVLRDLVPTAAPQAGYTRPMSAWIDTSQSMRNQEVWLIESRDEGEGQGVAEYDAEISITVELVDSAGRRVADITSGPVPGTARVLVPADLLADARPPRLQTTPAAMAEVSREALRGARVVHMDGTGLAEEWLELYQRALPGTLPGMRRSPTDAALALITAAGSLRSQRATGTALFMYGTHTDVVDPADAAGFVTLLAEGDLFDIRHVASGTFTDGNIGLPMIGHSLATGVSVANTVSGSGKDLLDPDHDFSSGLGELLHRPGGAGSGYTDTTGASFTWGTGGERSASDTAGEEDLLINLGRQYVYVATWRRTTRLLRHGEPVVGNERPVPRRVVLIREERDALQWWVRGKLPVSLDEVADALERYAGGELHLNRRLAVQVMLKYRAELAATGAPTWPELPDAAFRTTGELAERLADRIGPEFPVAEFPDTPGRWVARGESARYLDDLLRWFAGRPVPPAPMREELAGPLRELLEYLNLGGGQSKFTDIDLRGEDLFEAVLTGVETVAPGVTGRNAGMWREVAGTFAALRADDLIGEMISPRGLTLRLADLAGLFDQVVEVDVRAGLGVGTPVQDVADALAMMQRYAWQGSGRKGSSSRSVGVSYTVGTKDADGAGTGAPGTAVTGGFGVGSSRAGGYGETLTQLQRIFTAGGVEIWRPITVTVEVRLLRLGPPGRTARAAGDLVRRAIGSTGETTWRTRLDGQVTQFVPGELLKDADGRPRPVPAAAGEARLADPRPVRLPRIFSVDDTRQHVATAVLAALRELRWAGRRAALVEHRVNRAFSSIRFNALLRRMAQDGGHTMLWLPLNLRKPGQHLAVVVRVVPRRPRPVIDRGELEAGFTRRSLHATSAKAGWSWSAGPTFAERAKDLLSGSWSATRSGAANSDHRHGDEDQDTLNVGGEAITADLDLDITVEIVRYEATASRWTQRPGLLRASRTGPWRAVQRVEISGGAAEARLTMFEADWADMLDQRNERRWELPSADPTGPAIRTLDYAALVNDAMWARPDAPVHRAIADELRRRVDGPLSRVRLLVNAPLEPGLPDPFMQARAVAAELGATVELDVTDAIGTVRRFHARPSGRLTSRRVDGGLAAALASLYTGDLTDPAHAAGLDLIALYRDHQRHPQAHATFADRVRAELPADPPHDPPVTATVVPGTRTADAVLPLWEADARLRRRPGAAPRRDVLTAAGAAPRPGARLSHHDRGGVGDVQELVAQIAGAEPAAAIRDLTAHLRHLGLEPGAPNAGVLWRMVDAEVRADRLPPEQRRLYLSLRAHGWQRAALAGVAEAVLAGLLALFAGPSLDLDALRDRLGSRLEDGADVYRVRAEAAVVLGAGAGRARGDSALAALGRLWEHDPRPPARAAVEAVTGELFAALRSRDAGPDWIRVALAERR